MGWFVGAGDGGRVLAEEEFAVLGERGGRAVMRQGLASVHIQVQESA